MQWFQKMKSYLEELIVCLENEKDIYKSIDNRDDYAMVSEDEDLSSRIDRLIVSEYKPTLRYQYRPKASSTECLLL